MASATLFGSTNNTVAHAESSMNNDEANASNGSTNNTHMAQPVRSNLHPTKSLKDTAKKEIQLTSVDSCQLSNHTKQLASSPISQHAQPDYLEEERIECDYVIIGHGKAGQSAVRTIKELEPKAKIVVIDPNSYPKSNEQQQSNNSISMQKRGILRHTATNIAESIQHLATCATSIDHSTKTIHIQPIRRRYDASSSDGAPASFSSCGKVHYRKSALIATGSRGAPPPDSCVRHDAKSRILELRSTTYPSPQSSIPVLDPPTVRSLSIMAASQSATVAIMGSGYDALELAAYCARVSKQSNNGQKGDAKKVQLIFGNSSPLSNILPRYLSSAITKRLRQNGIEVEERAMTRYISLANTSNADNTPRKLEIYTVKSYDSLESSQLLADLLVYAPNVDGLNGTAIVPVPAQSNSSNSLSAINYQPWSQLISPPLVTSYLDDGRISTNSEFLAASSLYAAGSVAKYPNAKTGQADVAGGRHVSSKLTGTVAAMNMVNSCSESSTLPRSYVKESIPVWRSDEVSSYLGRRDGQGNGTLALYSMGIHALSVGKCDSENLATHGFWWTNTNQSNNNNNETKNGNGKGSSRSNSPNAFMRRATKRSSNTMNESSISPVSGRGSLPVYGSGVMYYLSRSGKIEGIMLWGLPFSSIPNNVQSSLNTELVDRLKEIIHSNGGIAIDDHSEKILKENIGLNIDMNLLSYLHLVEESKHLASLALSGCSTSSEQSKRVSVMRKPLHRYTPIKPSELSNLSKITRRDEAGHTAEEDDLFYPSLTSTATTSVEESGRPPSLKRIYPMQGGIAFAGTEEYELERNLERQQLQRQRARPSREDPLWLRLGDENRYINKRDALADSFARNIQRGVWMDGSDAVQQAPVPQAILDAKVKWNKWNYEDEEEGVDEQ